VKDPDEHPEPSVDQLMLYAQEIAKARAGDLSRRMARGRSSMKLLVVDDDEQLRALIATTFAGDAYEIVEAGNAEEALLAARDQHPNVALLDINMPGMNGIDLCRRMKADDELRAIRVVMLTGAARPSAWQEALAAGADSYLGKPFRPGELLQVVEQMMRPN
jgi:CheY-like chemotaxis protein